MPRLTRSRYSRLTALAIVAILSLTMVTGASADPQPGRGPGPTPGPVSGDCAVLRVHLNGIQPATQTCLAHASPDGRVTSAIDCWASDLRLYSDSNFGGRKICFSGEGSANLSDYGFGWVRTWSDKMSSYQAGEHCGILWENSNQSGLQLRFSQWGWATSMGSFWDDRISSFSIFAFC